MRPRDQSTPRPGDVRAPIVASYTAAIYLVCSCDMISPLECPLPSARVGPLRKGWQPLLRRPADNGGWEPGTRADVPTNSPLLGFCSGSVVLASSTCYRSRCATCGARARRGRALSHGIRINQESKAKNAFRRCRGAALERPRAACTVPCMVVSVERVSIFEYSEYICPRL